jgi:chromate transporter
MKPNLPVIVREWTRIGTLGFGGPPAHIRMLRKLCVEDNSWVTPDEFEDAVAAVNLLPGPASTQLAIYLAWKQRGKVGALLGGLSFILPGLIAIVILSYFFLDSNAPGWIIGAGLGAGAAIPAIALSAGWSLVSPSRARCANSKRWYAYLILGVVAVLTLGSWAVLAIILCGLIELAIRHKNMSPSAYSVLTTPKAAVVTLSLTSSIAWVAFKVGALSYGGGFVIIPLMQFDAVTKYHWMTGSQFLTAVALGQITPGPVVQTVSAVGFAAAGITGALVAAFVAFAPSFIFVLLGAKHFENLLKNSRVRAFIDGAGPVAIGLIIGSAFLLGRQFSQTWQYGLLAVALGAVFAFKRGTVAVIASAAMVGVLLNSLLS